MADHVNEPHNNGLLWHVESSQDLTPNQPKGSIRTPKQPQGPIMTNTQSTTTFHKEKHPINNHKVPSGKTPNQQPQGSIKEKHPINNHKVPSGQTPNQQPQSPIRTINHKIQLGQKNSQITSRSLMHCTRHIMFQDNWKRMPMNEPGGQLVFRLIAMWSRESCILMHSRFKLTFSLTEHFYCYCNFFPIIVLTRGQAIQKCPFWVLCFIHADLHERLQVWHQMTSFKQTGRNVIQ